MRLKEGMGVVTFTATAVYCIVDLSFRPVETVLWVMCLLGWWIIYIQRWRGADVVCFLGDLFDTTGVLYLFSSALMGATLIHSAVIKADDSVDTVNHLYCMFGMSLYFPMFCMMMRDGVVCKYIRALFVFATCYLVTASAITGDKVMIFVAVFTVPMLWIIWSLQDKYVRNNLAVNSIGNAADLPYSSSSSDAAVPLLVDHLGKLAHNITGVRYGLITFDSFIVCDVYITFSSNPLNLSFPFLLFLFVS
jgi:hypothetical protein